MFDTTEIALSITIIGILYYVVNEWLNRNSIPGPVGLPVLGNLLSWGTHPYKKFGKWSSKYGNIFQINLAGLRLVVLNDFKQIREAFNMENFSGRCFPDTFTEISGGKYGIATADGQQWNEQRRFTIRHLRDFGVGKKGMEPLIMDEVVEMLEWMKSQVGNSCSIHERFNLAVLNSLWKLVAGERYSQDDPKLNILLKSSNEVLAETVINPMMFLFPKLTKMFPSLIGYNKFLKKVEFLHQFYKEQINEHKRDFYDENQESRDLIDAYLKQMAKTDDKNSSFYKEIGDKNLLAVLNDIFVAGSDTSATTLSWAILYLTYLDNGPEIAKKMQIEIDRVIGRNRLPSLEDRPELPYVEAVIMEVLRKSPTVVVGLLHKVTRDTEFYGYKLRKGIGLMGNFYAVHNSKEIWGDPENFRPEHFIDENGQCMRKHEGMMAFSLGTRRCIGETLARDTLFLFLTSIYQKFNVVPCPKYAKNVDFEPAATFVFCPKPFTVQFIERD